MVSWWYYKDEQQVGPVELDQLASLLRQEQVGPDTLIWSQGMDQWLPLRDVETLQTVLLTPPPINSTSPPILNQHKYTAAPYQLMEKQENTDIKPELNDSNRAKVQEVRSPTWRRFFARAIDLYLIVIVGIITSVLALSFLSPPFQIWIQNPTNGTIYAVIIFVFAPLMESVVSAAFGNSPGKALLGLSVVDLNGKHLNFKSSLVRNYRVFWFGLGAGIPLINLFTMLLQYNSIKSKGAAVYDLGRNRVAAAQISSFRYVSAAGLFIAMALTNVVLQKLDAADKYVFAQGQDWVNPVTFQTVGLPAGWVPSATKNSDDQEVYIFTRPSEELQVIFAGEKVSSSLILERYILAFVGAVKKDMSILPPAIPALVNGQVGQLVRGNMVSAPTTRLTATFFKQGSTIWRTVAIRLRGANPETKSHSDLRAKLFSSVGIRRSQ
ncbi:MAG: hypothetical protein ACI9XZ_004343 [Alphaproteobacteria bacterium]|jgi:hypothetical protein